MHLEAEASVLPDWAPNSSAGKNANSQVFATDFPRTAPLLY